MSSHLTAADIAKALKGRRSGRDFVACCPAHDDHTPSLSIADGADGDLRVLIYCHAGCSQFAVIAALKKLGLWPSRVPRWRNRTLRRPPGAQQARKTDADPAKITHDLSLWVECEPVTGTLAETYLRQRGITIALPGTIRFHPNLKHTLSRTWWPAMMALITDGVTNDPIGIQRTFLAKDGLGKAPIKPERMMLGRVSGVAVRLADAEEFVMIGEGLETCLSVMQATGKPAWAALSTSGLQSLNLPPGIRSVVILADGDPPGEAAAQAAAGRLQNSVRAVRLVRAPQGADFNDVLVNPNSSEKKS